MPESLPVKPAPLWETPNLDEENGLLARGYRRIAGVDEAGRGAWVGPVCAAAVVLPLDRPDLLRRLADVRNSKQLSPRQREALSRVIREVALAVGVGRAEVEEIEGLGILPATRLAMARAVQQLSVPADALLIDYVRLPDIPLPQRALPRADARCLSVAAASIIAKVERDRWMVEMDRECPGYGFADHKGYGTPLSTAGHSGNWGPLPSTGGPGGRSFLISADWKSASLGLRPGCSLCSQPGRPAPPFERGVSAG